jgi:hypothetical protein
MMEKMTKKKTCSLYLLHPIPEEESKERRSRRRGPPPIKGKKNEVTPNKRCNE